ncbi:Bug family tripartite tricarboxylate transporter substrate binding protein [Rhodoplanes sp. Z2-YC6860]|uniref:Bug family tripartite tricarboxylate transporter substrate binding protein n=1 Tax=Rhodoplanes sp. Z2-YC6860 TaxID=674703 RepID=UPI00078D4219|nr:tripartite tricarboxylate transporter substrate binding protein [Rhodoplanes sp. Z2-YC6860]AMN39348.1 extra-cytoplasmic solute receptor protein [Rhodoplanes sp. Z2-YC6860]
MKFAIRALAFSATLLFAAQAFAQGAGPGGWPNKPVKIIVPFAPGGPTDTAARLISQKMSENLKQQFYIENQAGAGGNLGMGNAAKAAPDGYTILFVSSSFVVNPSLYDRVPYDPYKDFTPLTVAATAANVLLVNPAVLPVNTPKELADLIKANPGKYTFASAGTGTTPHLSGELFKLTYKLDTVHVPFGGAGPAIQSIVAGHTPLAFTSLPPAVPFIKDGTLRALAVANKTRVKVLPDVPTLAEAGIPDQEADTFQAVLVPAGVPKDISNFIYQEVVKATKSPEVTAKMDQLGLEIICNTPEEFARQIKFEIDKWGKVIHDAGIKVQ